MLKGKKFNAFALEDIAPKTAHQLLCGCISTVMHMSPSCCARVFLLMCREKHPINPVVEKVMKPIYTDKKNLLLI